MWLDTDFAEVGGHRCQARMREKEFGRVLISRVTTGTIWSLQMTATSTDLISNVWGVCVWEILAQKAFDSNFHRKGGSNDIK